MRTPVQRITDDAKRRELAAALERTGGNRDAAARILGIGRATVFRWLDAFPDLAKRYPGLPPTGRPVAKARDRKK